ncbi:helix-turn-helix domain-containing protein [Aminobacter sp. NyZ550]|uniref:helix-turn-helix domain-containing protein n=1 Tax=Aminobacter sp. NyZ550 TaxID=2979870 RepID=UPI0021D5A33E|nr:helix-turn-helix domain-containing protein [Aminobacter sp. NyZ550]WAX96629.1 helix-turn-helix domain-containing protein [Aminobacter sp. NyZ550]
MKNVRKVQSGVALAQGGALTVDETADYLRVCRSTVYKLFKDGDLVPARVRGRTLVRRADADEFLRRCVGAA